MSSFSILVEDYNQQQLVNLMQSKPYIKRSIKLFGGPDVRMLLKVRELTGHGICELKKSPEKQEQVVKTYNRRVTRAFFFRKKSAIQVLDPKYRYEDEKTMALLDEELPKDRVPKSERKRHGVLISAQLDSVYGPHCSYTGQIIGHVRFYLDAITTAAKPELGRDALPQFEEMMDLVSCLLYNTQHAYGMADQDTQNKPLEFEEPEEKLLLTQFVNHCVDRDLYFCNTITRVMENGRPISEHTYGFPVEAPSTVDPSFLKKLLLRGTSVGAAVDQSFAEVLADDLYDKLGEAIGDTLNERLVFSFADVVADAVADTVAEKTLEFLEKKMDRLSLGTSNNSNAPRERGDVAGQAVTSNHVTQAGTNVAGDHQQHDQGLGKGTIGNNGPNESRDLIQAGTHASKPTKNNGTGNGDAFADPIAPKKGEDAFTGGTLAGNLEVALADSRSLLTGKNSTIGNNTPKEMGDSIQAPAHAAKPTQSDSTTGNHWAQKVNVGANDPVHGTSNQQHAQGLGKGTIGNNCPNGIGDVFQATDNHAAKPTKGNGTTGNHWAQKDNVGANEPVRVNKKRKQVTNNTDGPDMNASVGNQSAPVEKDELDSKDDVGEE
jgi:hypothetical protein